MRHTRCLREPSISGWDVSARRRRELRWIFAVIFAGNLALRPVLAREVPFSEQSVDADVSVPLVVSVCDLDGDGDLDGVVGSLGSGGSTIYWYENSNGGGAFAGPQTLATDTNSIESVATADVDGDGDLDILFAVPYDGEILWLENTDAGAFATAQVLATETTNPTLVVAADLDGDGDLDLVAASRPSDDGIYWYENGGNGSFGTQQVITQTPQEPSAIAVADLDGDGDSDVAVGSDSVSGITWYANDGAGTFSTRPAIFTAASDVHSLEAADLDGDGDLDLLATVYDDDSVRWFENTDGSSFASGGEITSGALGASSAVAADIDGDGDLDVASTSHDDDTVAWYENTDGLGTFGSQQAIGTLNEAGQSFVGDIDRDGDLDVVAAEISESGSIAWYENETIHRSALYPVQTVISTAASGEQVVLAGDIDRDGDLDAVAVASGGLEIDWYENTDGVGHFGAKQVISTGLQNCYSAFLADIDGDGDTDVLAAASGDNKIVWYDNSDGAGGFGSEQVIVSGVYEPRWVVAADIDGDGDLDALAALYGEYAIAWYENDPGDTDAKGSFGTGQVITSTVPQVVSVAAADVDGDGDVDALAALPYEDSIAWYENTDGAGNFGSQRLISTVVDRPYSILGADIDGDGDVDILSGSVDDKKVAWYENSDGAGNFGSQQILSTLAYGVYALVVADLDSDGDLDVVAPNYFDDEIAWYENTGGSGLFSPPQLVTTLRDGPFGVFAADVDRDGDSDLLSASYGDDTVAWYENRGGQFSLATTDVAQGFVANSEVHDLLKITVTHEGRAGDSDVELARLELHFTDGSSTPLAQSEVAALIQTLRLYVDDGSTVGAYDSADSLADSISIGSMSDLGGGVLRWILTDDLASLQVGYGTPRTYFLVAEMTSDAESQDPGAFDVEHLTESSSRGEDAPNDIPLILEYVANLQGGVVSTTFDDDTCHAPFDLQLHDRTVSGPVTCEAGTVLTTGANVFVSSPSGDLTLRAGQSIDVEDGLSVEGALTAEIDPGLEP